MKEIHTLIADNQPFFIKGLTSVFKSELQPLGLSVDAITSDSAALLALKERSIDLILLDPNIKGVENAQKISEIRLAFPKAYILLISNFNNPKVVKSMLKAGADGYILKTATVDELRTAINQVMEGKTFTGRDVVLAGKAQGVQGPDQAEEERFAQKYALTRREMEILLYIGQALNNREIAERLYISDQTVSVHRKNIMRKIGVRSTANLIKLTYEYSLM